MIRRVVFALPLLVLLASLPKTVSAESFTYAGGTIFRVGDVWFEVKQGTQRVFAGFVELYRSSQMIVLYDRSRGLLLRLPVPVGMAMRTSFGVNNWTPLYEVIHQP